MKQYSSLSMQSFPPSSQVWTRSQKQLFLVFMRILIKYLELTHLEAIRQHVMEAIAQCRSSYLQLRATTATADETASIANPVCLTSMLHDHLRSVVPDDTWRQTEIYMDQYLRSRRTRSMRIGTTNYDHNTVHRLTEPTTTDE